MKIWIDGYEANTPQRLGSGQVGFGLLKSLEKIDHKNEYTILLPTKPFDDLPKERTGWKYKILKPKRLWTRIALPLHLYTTREKPDLVFSPTHYIPRFSPVKRVVTIFDLAYLDFPQMFPKSDLYKLTRWTQFSIQNSDHIITISDSSKRDIIKHYGIRADKITVAYPGTSGEFHAVLNLQRVKEVQRKYGVLGNYLIYIGTIQPRKNLIKLFQAFAKVVGENTEDRIQDLSLVVVGKTSGEGRQGWQYQEILKAPENLGIKDKVKFIGFVPTNELVLLLNGAQVLILVSLYEGFGLPVVEAMSCGVPVISSKVSSLPEVVGEAGLLVDPSNQDQIEQAIRTIVTDKKLRNKLSKAGVVQAKKFSWENMAKTVLRVFEKMQTI